MTYEQWKAMTDDAKEHLQRHLADMQMKHITDLEIPFLSDQTIRLAACHCAFLYVDFAEQAGVNVPKLHNRDHVLTRIRR